jgi:tRNA uracil 4-sulfurtransferase
VPRPGATRKGGLPIEPVEYQVFVAHYHEVGLKGRNRNLFENRLVRNIRSRLRGTDYARVSPISGRLLVRLRPGNDIALMADRLATVFGLAGYAPAIEAEPTMDSLVDSALRLARSATFGSFAVRARRGHSVFKETSQRINEVVGQAIKDDSGARVDLTNPDWTCHIELVERTAFLYGERFSGPGGLPVGVSGKVMALMSGGIDSPVAAWEVAKRGADVELVHFHGQPFADPSSVRQATRLAEHLAPWLMGTRLWLVPFGEIQAEIVTSAPQELRVVLYRRFMMRIAEALARREGAEGLVTGESLGQVASQTLPNLLAINSVVEYLPVLRPLIGRDKTEIEALARRVGSYEISIDPHQDCCVLFVPRRVTTHARLPELEAAEEAVHVEALVDKGLANSTVVDVGF